MLAFPGFTLPRIILLCVPFVLALLMAIEADASPLMGTVGYPDGRHAAGAVVYALNADARLNIHNNTIMSGEALPRVITDREGKFRIEDLAWAPALVLAQDMNDALGWKEIGGRDGLVTVVIQPAAPLTVAVKNGPDVVVDEEVRLQLRTPVPGLNLEYVAPTSRDGTAQFRPIPGAFDISTWHSVPQVGCCFRAVMTRHAQIELAPGARETVVLGGTDLPYVAGTVTDTEGTALHGVWVRLSRKSSPDSGTVWSTVTARNGQYAIYDAPAGEYELRCFRRLALNDGSRTLEAVQSIVLTDEGPRTRNSRDIQIDLAEFEPLSPGTPAPEFAHATVDGEKFGLADHRGKWVLLHFFASWCAPCVATASTYDEIAAELKGAGLVVVGASLDETAVDLETYLEEHPMNHPAIYAGSWSQNPLREAYRVVNIPTTFVIDPEGKIDQVDAHGEVLKKYLRENVGQ